MTIKKMVELLERVDGVRLGCIVEFYCIIDPARLHSYKAAGRVMYGLGERSVAFHNEKELELILQSLANQKGRKNK